MALLGRATDKQRLGDSPGSMADLAEAARIPDADWLVRVKILIGLAAAKIKTGDPKGAADDCTTVIDTEGALGDDLEQARLLRGKARAVLGDTAGAKADLKAIVTSSYLAISDDDALIAQAKRELSTLPA